MYMPPKMSAPATLRRLLCMASVHRRWSLLSGCAAAAFAKPLAKRSTQILVDGELVASDVPFLNRVENLDYVHDIDLSPIGPDPALRSAIEALSGRKVIFTNGSTDHAKNITRHLEIDHHFDGTFDIIDSRLALLTGKGLLTQAPGFCGVIQAFRCRQVQQVARGV